MVTIRRMRPEHAEAVRQVDSIAFGAWTRQAWGKQPSAYRRTLTNVLACLEKDPEGCFVAQQEGHIVGFIFSRTWGGVGWFGTFAVLPDCQGRGLGRRLIAASLDYLQRDPARLIGLETMFDSPYNLGLYLKLGFRPSYPTFLLTREIDRSVTGPVRLPIWSDQDAVTRECWLADLRVATGQVQPGLDYSKEIVAASHYGFGQALVLVDGLRAVGLSVIWLASGWEGVGEERASVQSLALHPGHTGRESLAVLLEATEALARTCGKDTLAIAVNGRHTWVLQQLLDRGYRISRAMVRCLLPGPGIPLSQDRAVDCSRWAG